MGVHAGAWKGGLQGGDQHLGFSEPQEDVPAACGSSIKNEVPGGQVTSVTTRCSLQREDLPSGVCAPEPLSSRRLPHQELSSGCGGLGVGTRGADGDGPGRGWRRRPWAGDGDWAQGQGWRLEWGQGWGWGRGTGWGWGWGQGCGDRVEDRVGPGVRGGVGPRQLHTWMKAQVQRRGWCWSPGNGAAALLCLRLSSAWHSPQAWRSDGT